MDIRSQLHDSLAKLASGGLCVAFSGGVDSAVLLRAACDAAPGQVHAVTLSTPFHPPVEAEAARRIAADCGAVHTVLTLSPMPPEVLANPPDRCYLCKRAIFQRLGKYAAEQGLAHVLDGTNADDLGEYRPGLRALAELRVKSPLAELGISKSQVRQLAAQQGSEVADKPSSPCLATRFPYHHTIDPALLPRLDRIEILVKSLGIPVVRARIHGEGIRLEVLPANFDKVLNHREALLETVLAEGFSCLSLDLTGYRSGSMDRLYFGDREV